MSYHRFILEPYKGKHTRYYCPKCKEPATFVRYIDTETGEQLHPNTGRCNREVECGYHYPPRQFFINNPTDANPQIPFKQSAKIHPNTVTNTEASTIPYDIFKLSLQNRTANHFVNFLKMLLGTKGAGRLVEQYFIGTSNRWDGATIFYQIDIQGSVRAGKVMLFNPMTGKRVKEPYNHLTWVHAEHRLADYRLQQCFFGEHLLALEPDKPVAIVESEKTAVIASAYLPEFIWLATGSKGGLTIEKCQVLQGRKVVLYPDLNCFDDWKAKAKELRNIAVISVSALLEYRATTEEKEQGLDLADYLIRLKLQQQSATASTTYKLVQTKEYYHHTFEELSVQLGYEAALRKVKYYQALSYQHRRSKSFVLHNCALLMSYSTDEKLTA